MRFKLFTLALALLVAVFGFGLNANAQLADGISTSLSVAASTGWTKVDEDYASYFANDLGGEADLDYNKHLLNKGARLVVKGKKGNVTAVGVLACGDVDLQTGTNNSNPLLLKGAQVQSYWATWTASNGFNILVGQNSSPSSNANINITYMGDNMFGFTSNLFNPFQVKLAMPVGPGSVYLAFVEEDWEDVAGSDWDYVDRMLPKLNIGYVIGGGFTDPIMIGAHLEYDQVKVDDEASEIDGDTIKAYRVMGNFKYNGIADMFDVTAHVYYGVNSAQLGYNAPKNKMASGFTQPSPGAPFRPTSAVFEDGEIKDATSIGGSVGLTINFFPHKLALAVGYDETESDSASYTEKNKEQMFAACFWYGLETNFYIIPSVIYKDHLKDSTGVKEGKETMIGLAWNASI